MVLHYFESVIEINEIKLSTNLTYSMNKNFSQCKYRFCMLKIYVVKDIVNDQLLS